MKKVALAIALVALTVGAEQLITIPVTYERNLYPLPFGVRIVAASVAASANSSTISVGIVQEFAFGTNKVAATNFVFNGTAARGVTNIVLASPVYAKQGDRLLCIGAGATNGTAKAELFIER